ncbi:hypothetical protein ACOMHN_043276 [Nucella lapillus]
MKSGPFVIGTDGSQEGGEKHYPIVVRFCDSNGYIQSKLLANSTSTDSSTGENIFHLLDDTLTSLGIDWTKCLSLVCDNAATMTGVNKGVISYVRKKTPKVHLAGCVCHLLNLAAKKATKAFQGEFDFDDILRQISWYMSKSTNREQRLKQLQKQCGTPELNVIDHCPTRWLSMGLALRRLLQQWKPLQMFFEEKCKKDIKGKSEEEKKRSSIRTRVHDFLKRSTAKLYALFLSFAMESFDILNQELQTDAAKIHVVKRNLEQFYRKLLISFVKPSALSSGTLLAVDFTAKYNMKDSKDILIGTATKQHISGLRDKVAEQFMKDVISFYQAACTYLKAKVFPVGEPLWKHAQVADIKLKETALFSSLDYFMERFPCLLPHEVGEDESPPEALTRAKDQLQAEFTDYQSWEVPSHLMTEEKVATEELWAQITKVKDCNEAMRFQVLPRVMLGILLLPVSNAACERVFSVARRNRTVFRSSMGKDTTEALLVLKSKGGACFENTFADNVLTKCKAATKNSLNWTCIQCLQHPLLYGDCFFMFVCSHCNQGQEYIKRLPFRWVDVAQLALFNLTLNFRHKYYDLDDILMPWVFENRHNLALDNLLEGKSVDSPEIRNKVEAALSGHRSKFMSGREVKKKYTLWGLILRVPPNAPCVVVPLSGPINSQVLSNPSIKGRKTKHVLPIQCQSPVPLRYLSRCSLNPHQSITFRSNGSGKLFPETNNNNLTNGYTSNIHCYSRHNGTHHAARSNGHNGHLDTSSSSDSSEDEEDPTVVPPLLPQRGPKKSSLKPQQPVSKMEAATVCKMEPQTSPAQRDMAPLPSPKPRPSSLDCLIKTLPNYHGMNHPFRTEIEKQTERQQLKHFEARMVYLKKEYADELAAFKSVKQEDKTNLNSVNPAIKQEKSPAPKSPVQKSASLSSEAKHRRGAKRKSAAEEEEENAGECVRRSKRSRMHAERYQHLLDSFPRHLPKPEPGESALQRWKWKSVVDQLRFGEKFQVRAWRRTSASQVDFLLHWDDD